MYLHWWRKSQLTGGAENPSNLEQTNHLVVQFFRLSLSVDVLWGSHTESSTWQFGSGSRWRLAYLSCCFWACWIFFRMRLQTSFIFPAIFWAFASEDILSLSSGCLSMDRNSFGVQILHKWEKDYSGWRRKYRHEVIFLWYLSWTCRDFGLVGVLAW